MCFAPQQRTFWTPELPKALRTRGVFSILSWKCASGHSGVRFGPQRRALLPRLNFQKCSETEVFLAFWLQNVLRATAACNFWFLICPGDAATFSRALIFPCSDSFSSLIFFLLPSSSLTLPTSAFPSLHIDGHLTSNFLRPYNMIYVDLCICHYLSL